MRIDSVNIGTIEEFNLGPRKILTAIKKRPTLAVCNVDFNGIIGDAIGDTKHHGGRNRAIHCFSTEHYELFKRESEEELPERPWVGENLTISGYTDKEVLIGDRIKIGSAIFEVSMPTERCSIPEQVSGIPRLTKWMINTLKTGFYLRVIKPGNVCGTDRIVIMDQGDPKWTIQKLSALMYNNIQDAKLIKKALNIDKLADEWKVSLCQKYFKKAK